MGGKSGGSDGGTPAVNAYDADESDSDDMPAAFQQLSEKVRTVRQAEQCHHTTQCYCLVTSEFGSYLV